MMAWGAHLARVVRVTALMAVAAGVIGWGGVSLAADPITDSNVDAAVAAAKTPGDHEALAAYFTSRAAEAQANVGRHTRMSTVFNGKGKAAWEAHCGSLSRTFKEQAGDYNALAKEQLAVAQALRDTAK